VADPLDGATVTVVVVGVVVAAVPVDAELPVLAELPVFAELVDFELEEAAVDWPVALVAVLVVVPPAWAASPAKTPVPVNAPASDQRVSFLIRRRPASRYSRLLASRLLAFAARLFMASIVAPPPQSHLRSR
jgi:hypothetical protein